MHNPFSEKMRDIKGELETLPLIPSKTQDQLSRIAEVFRDSALFTADMDHTLTGYKGFGHQVADKSPVTVGLAYLLYVYLFSGERQRSMAVLTGALEDQPLALVKNQFLGEAGRLFNGILYIGSANGNRLFAPAGREKINYQEDMRRTLGLEGEKKLNVMIQRVLLQARRHYEMFGSFEVDHKGSSIAIFYETSNAFKKEKCLSEMKMILADELKASDDLNLRDRLQVAVSSVAVNLSFKNKGDAMDVVIADVADRLRIEMEDVKPIAFGDSALDLPMIKKALEHGGAAVWVGYEDDASLFGFLAESSEEQKQKCIILPNERNDHNLYGSIGTTAVIKFLMEENRLMD